MMCVVCTVILFVQRCGGFQHLASCARAEGWRGLHPVVHLAAVLGVRNIKLVSHSFALWHDTAHAPPGRCCWIPLRYTWLVCYYLVEVLPTLCFVFWYCCCTVSVMAIAHASYRCTLFVARAGNFVRYLDMIRLSRNVAPSTVGMVYSHSAGGPQKNVVGWNNLFGTLCGAQRRNRVALSYCKFPRAHPPTAFIFWSKGTNYDR